jgi:putative membrane protein insertion efficiency factor
MDAKKIEINGNSFELDVDPKDAVIIERHFSRYTVRDMQIRKLPVPEKPLWLNLIVRLIRFYQKYISHRLGNRCVFDPSCSHYAESAFRQNGFFKGIKQTIKRLNKCRPQNGGIHELQKPKH